MPLVLQIGFDMRFVRQLRDRKHEPTVSNDAWLYGFKYQFPRRGFLAKPDANFTRETLAQFELRSLEQGLIHEHDMKISLFLAVSLMGFSWRNHFVDLSLLDVGNFNGPIAIRFVNVVRAATGCIHDINEFVTLDTQAIGTQCCVILPNQARCGVTEMVLIGPRTFQTRRICFRPMHRFENANTARARCVPPNSPWDRMRREDRFHLGFDLQRFLKRNGVGLFDVYIVDTRNVGHEEQRHDQRPEGPEKPAQTWSR
jgi:hypothetical protein